MQALRKVTHDLRSFKQPIPQEDVFIEKAKHVGGRLGFSAQEKLPSDSVAQNHGKHRQDAKAKFTQPKLFWRHSLAGF
jgi:hypothetical protein